MKNALRIVLTIFGTLLALGCGADQKPEENAFVAVTGHDLDQLSRRVSSLEVRMRETQTLLLHAREERNELRTRLQAIEARFTTTGGGARPIVSPSDPAATTPRTGNNEKETPKRIRH